MVNHFVSKLITLNHKILKVPNGTFLCYKIFEMKKTLKKESSESIIINRNGSDSKSTGLFSDEETTMNKLEVDETL